MKKMVAAIAASIIAVVALMMSMDKPKYETPACFSSQQVGILILVDSVSGKYVGKIMTNPFGGELVYAEYDLVEDHIFKYNFEQVDCETGKPLNSPEELEDETTFESDTDTESSDE